MNVARFQLAQEIGLFDACLMYEALCNIVVTSASVDGDGYATINYYRLYDEPSNTDVSYSCIHAADYEE